MLVVGRVLVYSDSDLATAYDLSKQIQLTPLSGWQPRDHQKPGAIFKEMPHRFITNLIFLVSSARE